ncbi:MAG TPA: class I SAM-dependent methyltransferase [Tepidisphaeraceae bacterium]|jgi:SAM-dependent methyltransferase
MTSPDDQRLVEDYLKNFAIAADFPLTAQMCKYHWELERRLKRELLASNPEARWETFERCYTTLYMELHWLYSGQPPRLTPEQLEAKHGYWRYWIGPPPRSVYEVGSGRGELIACLAHLGYECRATEVTRERGQRWVDEMPNLTWGTTDGVHLAQFEPANTYDAVISDQVVEHLHPDDMVEHLRGALQILKPGGRYVFRTPHVHDGPSDISRFFGSNTPQGMHLREYTYRELAARMKEAGFRNVRTRTPRPRVAYRAAKVALGEHGVDSLYLRYLCMLESAIRLLPTQAARRRAAHFGPMPLRFEPSIVLFGDKAGFSGKA